MADSGANALVLRRAIYGKGDATRADLADLLARGAEFGADPDFRDLVAEVARDVFVEDVDPQGYVSADDAAWLMARLGGGLSCHAEFDVLKAIFAHAVSVPAALTEFSVREIEQVIISGRRDAIGGVDHVPGVVTSEDVEALRACAFAATEGSSLHVTRGVAECLFDIAHATAKADNAPEFATFFAQAVGNYLMGAAYLTAPDRNELLAAERELDKPTSFGSFLSSMFHRPDGHDVYRALHSLETVEEAAIHDENIAADRALAAASSIDASEAKWVIEHLTRDGPLTEAERRLIAFIRDEATGAPPEITALYAQAA